MFNFPYPLVQGEHPEKGVSVFGFVHDDMLITDPFMSACGRFRADPASYGLTADDAARLVQLNALLEKATFAAIDEGCKTVQDGLGIGSGDVAGLFFSDAESVRSISKTLADYIQLELGFANRTA